MRILAAVFLSFACWSCGPTDQPSNMRTVAAVEVPLRTPTDRRELIAMLRRNASVDGLHVDDVSKDWINFTRDTADVKKSIYVGAWRGDDDDDIEVIIDDGGHLGRAWIKFFEGKRTQGAGRFRARMLGEIERHWPDVQELPILPSGGLPLAEHLRLTPAGYKIVRSAAGEYNLPASSPLLEP